MKNKDVKRVFIGIPAGHQIKSILTIIKSADNCKSSFIKWIPIENIHLTLSFLGNMSNYDILDFIKLIEHNITITPFKISISKTGIFPAVKSPKVLWLSVDKGIDELQLLHHEIKKSIGGIKDNYEENIFIPHITIAKIKMRLGKIDVLSFLNTVYSPIELEVNFICMYESKLFPEGSQYTVLNTFPLN